MESLHLKFTQIESKDLAPENGLIDDCNINDSRAAIKISKMITKLQQAFCKQKKRYKTRDFVLKIEFLVEIDYSELKYKLLYNKL